MANETVLPLVGSLSTATSDAEFVNSGDMRLNLVGYAPSIALEFATQPAGTLSFASSAPRRPIGLQFDGQTPFIVVSSSPVTGSLALAGNFPSVFQQPPVTVSPDTALAVLQGHVATLSVQADEVLVGSLSLASDAPIATVTDPVFTFFGQLSVTGSIPEVLVANQGTIIQNLDASEDAPNRYDICDRSGFKAKPGTLIPTWDGLMVLPEFWEPRNQQDLIRSREEKQQGAIRPEPIGSEREIDVEFPDGVTPDDL